MAHEFQTKEIIDLYKKFLAIDSDKNGTLSRQEWNQALLAGLDHKAEDFDLADINKDNNLSFPEYVKLVSEIYKRRGQPSRPKSAQTAPGLTWQQVWDAYEIFGKVDANRSGYISAAELGAALGQNENSAAVTKIMSSLDRNQSKQLSFEEFLKGVQLGVIVLTKPSKTRVAPNRGGTAGQPSNPMPEKLKIEAATAFKKFDTNNSGTINMSEFADLMKIINPHLRGPDINRLYAKLDTDTSGLINVDEFLQGCAAGFIDLSKLSLGSDQPSSDYEWEIPYSELSFGTKLGEGTFGVVYKGSWRGTTVAIKKLKVEMATDVLKDFRDEIAILGKLRHPSVILFMGACTAAPNFCIVTEYMEGGSVYDAMHKRKLQLSRAQILKMASQVAKGINYLHKSRPKIVHRDLKSLNCLVDDYWNVKVADFGLSCCKATDQLRDQVGTPAFMAPELLLGRPYTEKVDQYSFAMCLWELLTGEFPFASSSFEQLQKLVPSNKRPKIPSSCGPELESLITRCWHSDPAQRPDFTDIINILDTLRSKCT